MFHIMSKLGIKLIVPMIFVVVELMIRKKRREAYSTIDILCKWFVFWMIGFGALSAGIMQRFNPSYTAGLLNIQSDNFIVIQELGCANISMSILGLFSIVNKRLRLPAAIVWGVSYISGCSILHILRMHVMNMREWVSLTADVWIVGVSIFIIVYEISKIRKRTVTKSKFNSH